LKKFSLLLVIVITLVGCQTVPAICPCLRADVQEITVPTDRTGGMKELAEKTRKKVDEEMEGVK
jgi:hypothetical protein